MPIKFRCSYCRQFLGISRGRAGDVVDCPTCGRGIRVPGLDGVVAPLPSPELNLRDAKLSRALDELAQWNAAAVSPIRAALAAEADEEIPQPIAEPIPIEVPIAPEPIAVRSPPSIAPIGNHVAGQSSQGEAEPGITVAAAIAELAQISAAIPETSPAGRVTFGAPHPAQPKSRRNTIILLMVHSLVMLAAGFLFAKKLAPPAVSVEPAAPDDAAAAAPELDSALAISGRITYKPPDGESLPDRGARVLLLPRERAGTAKLSANGFRAADHPADFRLAQAALRSLGGDLAMTDDGGNFSAELPNPGTFQILVISNFASRADDDLIAPDLLRQLTPYFEQPAQVLGRTKVHFGQVRYKGTGPEVWDHSF